MRARTFTSSHLVEQHSAWAAMALAGILIISPLPSPFGTSEHPSAADSSGCTVAPCIVGAIPVGNGPEGIAYDSAKGELFVANTGSQSVDVISDSSNEVVATIPIRGEPYGVAYDPAQGYVFVTNALSDNISVISDATDKIVGDVLLSQPVEVITYDSGRDEIFVANYTYGTPGVPVYVISCTTLGLVGTIQELGFSTVEFAYDSGKGEVYASYSDTEVAIISDVSDRVVGNLSGWDSNGVAYDSSKGEVFISSRLGNNVTAVSDTNNSVLGTTLLSPDVGGGSLVYDSEAGEIYVIGGWLVFAVSDTTYKVVGTVSPGAWPAAMAYDSARGEVFVTNYKSNNVSVIADSPSQSVSFTPYVEIVLLFLAIGVVTWVLLWRSRKRRANGERKPAPGTGSSPLPVPLPTPPRGHTWLYHRKVKRKVP